MARTPSTDEASHGVTIPKNPHFEVELKYLTDSETGEQRYELEFEVRWTE